MTSACVSHHLSLDSARGLAGFGVRTRIIGARGDDEWAGLFMNTLSRSGVDVGRFVSKPGATGRCCILSSGPHRTMRTCLANAARFTADDLRLEDFAGG
jgi:sugar/nucleoside kinase (ribokinase family)